MEQRNTGKRTEKSSSVFSFSERTHPYRTFMFLGLVGSGILFLAMVFMFIIWLNNNPPIENFKVPKSFMVSTIVMLITSYLVVLANRYLKEDHAKGLLLSLTGALLLSGVFSLLQVLGWKDIYDQGFYLDGDAGIALLYVISAIHFLHVCGGMIYLFYLTLKVFDIWNDPVRSLLYFSNKYEAVRLELFSSYWHYLDGLWLFLFLTFLFSF